MSVPGRVWGGSPIVTGEGVNSHAPVSSLRSHLKAQGRDLLSSALQILALLPSEASFQILARLPSEASFQLLALLPSEASSKSQHPRRWRVAPARAGGDTLLDCARRAG